MTPGIHFILVVKRVIEESRKEEKEEIMLVYGLGIAMYLCC